ncbi:C4-dicarboxylate TRAP transporter substrate-binding protein [Histidinibacterium aquaticum]|uniref:C4-dicarboxylate ABC transporter substrate-binding protein n=1 Tax=Histidinibacterium aquaticum TaxID=2613962 RepID=A0A5J5GJ19_9RHOB|nr:C4-dicarboxylate TRAP transporter substrate-binding protein [Histidinibacterium aquaticum]KAA9008231.1 C4-dicarboxylate ABC transporter substrate-binding protein [Histidinibacterium aquaticum]
MNVTLKSIALAAFALPSAGLAQEMVPITISSSHPTSVPWVGSMQTYVVEPANARLEEMGSDYRIEWTEAFGGSLYDFNETLEAVEEGLTDMGWVGALWEGSKMPLQNIMFSTPFVTSDPVVAVEVLNEMNDTIPEMQEEWTSHNLVFLGASVNDTYHLLTTFPVESLADLDGRTIVGAPALGPWLGGTGAVPVAGGLPTMYQTIQTGVAEGTIIIPTGAYPLRLHEVAPYVTLVDTGVTTIGGLAVNADSWERFPEDVQTVLMELGREYSMGHAQLVKETSDQIVEQMEADGATVTRLPEEERTAWVEGLPDLGEEWVATVAADGLPGEEIMSTYMSMMEEKGAEPMRDWSE